jgi:CheY-like chemotaxis protein
MVDAARTPKRILIVEDEMLIAMLVEDIVNGFGHEVVGPAMTLEHALQLAREEAFDCAILDVNLGCGTSSAPIAELLVDRGISFMFATGYGSKGLSPQFADRVVVRKPFVAGDIAAALQRILG